MDELLHLLFYYVIVCPCPRLDVGLAYMYICTPQKHINCHTIWQWVCGLVLHPKNPVVTCRLVNKIHWSWQPLVLRMRNLTWPPWAPLGQRFCRDQGVLPISIGILKMQFAYQDLCFGSTTHTIVYTWSTFVTTVFILPWTCWLWDYQ